MQKNRKNTFKRLAAGLMAAAMFASYALPVYADDAVGDGSMQTPTPTLVEAAPEGVGDATPETAVTPVPSEQPAPVEPVLTEEQAALEAELLNETPSLALFSLQAMADEGEPQTVFTIKNGEKVAQSIIDPTDIQAFKLAAMAFTLQDSYDYSYADPDSSSYFKTSTTLRLDDNWLASRWDAVATVELENLYMAAADADPANKWEAYTKLGEALAEQGISGPSYTYQFGTDFYLPDYSPYVVEGIVDGVKIPIANLTYERDDVKGLCVNIAFDPYVLALNSVKANFDCHLKLSAELFEDSDTVDISWDEDKLLLVVEGNLEKKNAPKHDSDISSDKTAALTTDKPYIDYTIRFDVTNETEVPSLDGLSMVDALPAGLFVESVTLQTNNDANPRTLTESGEGEQPGADNFTQPKDEATGIYTLNYTFPADGSVKWAVFAVRAALTPEEYQKFMDAGTGYTHTFENKAELRDLVNDVLYKETPAAPTDMEAHFFTKDGEQNQFDGNLIDWTIEVNTHFTYGVSSYIIDKIDPTQHNYEVDSLSIKENGEPEYKRPLVNRSGDARLNNWTYDLLTSPAMKDGDTESEIRTLLKALTDSDTRVIYFTNSAGESIMIIPFDNLLNKKVEISYSTRLTAQTLGDPAGVTNDVKMIWNTFGYGPGPGTPLEWDLEITKRVTGSYNYIQKSAGNYDAATHTMTWNFKVNQYQETITGLDLYEMDFEAVDPDSWTYSYYKDGVLQHENVQLPAGHAGDPEQTFPFYEQNAPDPATGKVSTYISFGDLTPSDYYEVQIKSDVSTQMAVVDENNKATVKNAASYKYKENGTTKSVNVTGEKTVDSILIQKDCVIGYNADTQTITWQVTVNAEKLPLNAATLTDLLPVGNVFGEMLSVTRGDDEATISGDKYNFTDGVEIVHMPVGTEKLEDSTKGVDPATGASQNTELFVFYKNGVADALDSGKYTFTYTTKMGTAENKDKEYLDTLLKTNKAEVVNTVQLRGNVGEAEVSIQNGTENYVSATVSTPLNDKALSKSGTFHKEAENGHPAGSITWEIVLNRGLVDMTGKIIKDDFAENPDPDILQLYIPEEGYAVKVETAASAEFTDRTDVTADVQAAFEESGKTTINSNGFTFTVPDMEKVKNKALIFTFDTLVTDDTNLGGIKNKVALYDVGATDPTESVTGGNDGGGDFWFDDYAEAQASPYIRVTKLSSSQSAGKDNLLPLEGAKFQITAYTKADDNIYRYDEALTLRARSTRSTGVVNFLNLRRNTLYKIVETDAPAGYDKKDEEKWVYFDTTTNFFASLFATRAFTVSDEKGERSVNAETVKANSKSYKYTVENTANGMVEFTKKDADGQVAADFTFELRRVSDSKVDVKTSTSDEHGTVSFTEVDPGRYEVYETFRNTADGDKPATPIGYGNISDKKLMTVTVPASGAVTFETEEPDYVTIDADKESAVVQNKLLTASVKLRKVDQNGDGLPGVVFRLFKGVSGTAETLPDGSYYRKTDANGYLTVSDLTYGHYKLVEFLDTDASYTKGKTVNNEYVWYEFDVGRDDLGKVTVDKVTLTKKAEVGLPEASSIPAAEITDGVFDLGTAVNTLKYAAIQTRKFSYEGGDITSQLLEGAKFEVKRVTKNDQGQEVKTLVMTLVTGAKNVNGNFESMQGVPNSYKDVTDPENPVAKVLVYGEYEIQEVAQPDRHSVPANAARFTVSDKTVGKPEATSNGKAPGGVWIRTEADDPSVLQAVVSGFVGGLQPSNPPVMNRVIRGTVALNKIGVNGAALSGAEFEVRDGETRVAMLTEDTNTKGLYNQLVAVTPKQSATIRNVEIDYVLNDRLLAGSYTIWETTTPTGYVAPTEAVASFTIDKDHTEIVFAGDAQTTDYGGAAVSNTPIEVDLPIKKVGNSTLQEPLENVTFTLNGNDMFGSPYVENAGVTKTTGINGTVTFEGLRVNNVGEHYTLREYGYTGNTSETNPTKVVKTYNVYVKDGGVIEVKEPVTVQDNTGESTSGEQPVNPTNGVWVLENQVVYQNFYFTKQGQNQENTTLTNAYGALEGAVFTLSNTTNSNISYTATSDDDGKVSFNNIRYGTYTLTETTVPVGYVGMQPKDVVVGKDGIEFDGTHFASKRYTTSEGETVYACEVPDAVKNDRVTAELVLKKVNKEDGTLVPEAKYRLLRITNSAFVEVGTFETSRGSNDKGTIHFTGLMANETYKIVETAAAPGYYRTQEEFIFTVDGAGNITPSQGMTGDTTPFVFAAKTGTTGNTLTWKEQPFRLVIEKENENGDKLSGAQFEIYKDGDETQQHGMTLPENLVYSKEAFVEGTGDNTGIYTLADASKLVAGQKYWIKEITAPAGYKLPSVNEMITTYAAMYSFTVPADYATTPYSSGNAPAIENTVENKLAPVKWQLNKYGKLTDGSGYKELGLPNTSGNGYNKTFYLKGDFIEISSSKIVTRDGEEGEENAAPTISNGAFETIMTGDYFDAQGLRMIGDGKHIYTLKEKESPWRYDNAPDFRFTITTTGSMEGYDVVYTNVITPVDANGNVIQPEDLDTHFEVTTRDTKAGLDTIDLLKVRDDPQTVSLSLTKYATDPAGEQGNQTLLEGATFTLKGTTFDGNTEFEKSDVTGTNGQLTLSGIPAGAYTLTETRRSGYERPTESFNVLVAKHTNENRLVTTITKVGGGKVTGDLSITNTKIRRSFSFTKVGYDSKAAGVAPTTKLLQDAEFFLYTDEDCQEPVQDPYTLVAAASDSKGVVTFTGLTEGTYYFKESQAPAGYALNTTKYKVELFEDVSITTSSENPEYMKFKLNDDGASAVVAEKDSASSLGLTVQNDVLKAELKLKKVVFDPADASARTTLQEGVTFTLTGKDILGNPIQAISGSTDRFGGLVLADIPLSEEGGYYTLTETNPPVNCDAPEVYHVTVTLVNGSAEAQFIPNGEASIPSQDVDGYYTIQNSVIRRDFSFTKKGVVSEDGTAADPLKGAVFTLRPDAYNHNDMTAESAANGVVTFTDLTVGKYYLWESAAAPGYTIPDELKKHEESPDAWTNNICVEVTAQGKVLCGGVEVTADNTITYTNARIQSEFTLKKVNGLDYAKDPRVITPVAGATYKLERLESDGTYTDVTSATSQSVPAVTNADGEIQFMYLLAGETYRLTETVTADGYLLPRVNQYILVVNDNGTLAAENGSTVGTLDYNQASGYTLYWKERPFALSFSKTSDPAKQNDFAQQGAQLALYDNREGNGNALYSGTTDANGVWYLSDAHDLQNGVTYWLHEIVAPDGFDVCEPVEFIVDRDEMLRDEEEKGAAYQGIALFDDVSIPYLTLYKQGIATDGTSEKLPLANAKFKLRGATVNDVFVMEKLDTETQTVEKSTFIMTKEDEYALVETDENGVLRFNSLTMFDPDEPTKSITVYLIPDGKHTYTLEEYDAPNNYGKADLISFTVTSQQDGADATIQVTGGMPTQGSEAGATVDASDTSRMIVTDAPLRTDLTLTKYSNENAAGETEQTTLDGATFQLKGTAFDGKTFEQEKTTENGGTLTFTGIPAGSYKLTETRVEGYEQPDSYEVTVTDVNGTLQTVVENVTNNSITNTKIRRSFSFTKQKYTDSEHTVTEMLPGAKFGIYTDAACTKPVTTLLVFAQTATSDANGVVTFKNLRCGTYYIKELEAPKNYALNDTVYTVVIGGDSTISNVPYNKMTVDDVEKDALKDQIADTGLVVVNNAKRTDIKLYKQGTDPLDKTNPIALGGVIFTLEGKDFRGADIPIQTDFTKADGTLTFTNIPAGSYELTEGKPDGYEQPVSYDVSVKDTANGLAVEIKAKGETASLPIHSDTQSYLVDNTLLRRSFTFAKYGYINEEETEHAPLNGAVFTLTDQKDLTKTFVSVQDTTSNTILFEDIPVGLYTLTETVVPVLHKAMEPCDVEITEDGSVKMIGGEFFREDGKKVIDTGVMCTNERKTMTVKLGKFNRYADPQTAAELAASTVGGATYQLYRIEKTGDVAVGEPVVTVKGQTLGFEGLMAGATYKLVETIPAPGFHLSNEYVTFTVDDEAVNIKDVKVYNADGTAGDAGLVEAEPTAILWYETPFALKLAKESRDERPLAGARFNICADDNGKPGAALYEDLETSVEPATYGDIILKDASKLVAGNTYWLVETTAPVGYDTTTVSFVADAAKTLTHAAPLADATQTVVVVDELTKVDLTVAKKGLRTDSSKEPQLLAGAQFGLLGEYFNDKTGEREGVFVEGLVTDENGKLTLSRDTLKNKDGDPLDLIADGEETYILLELNAPDGYALTLKGFKVASRDNGADVVITMVPAELDVDYDKDGPFYNYDGTPMTREQFEAMKIVAASGTAAVMNSDTSTLVVTDDYKTTDLTLTKYDNESQTVLAGAKFTLSGYAFDDPDEENELSWPQQTSDENGMLSFADIPAGEYTLNEERVEGYEKAAAFHVTVEDDGENGLNVIVTGEGVEDDKITNTVIRRDFSFTKTDAKLRAAKGAKFGLFTGAVAAADEKPIQTAVSGEDGSVTFTGLGCGSYHVKELEAPLNYILNETVYTVVVGGDTTITTIPVYNELTFGDETVEALQGQTAKVQQTVVNEDKTTSIHLYKQGVDLNDPKNPVKTPLSGVKFTLNGKDFHGDEVVREVTSDQNGFFTLQDLPACLIDEQGESVPYLLTETRPDGYEAPHSYDVVVMDDEDPGVGMITSVSDHETGAMLDYDIDRNAVVVDNTQIRRSFSFVKILKDREHNIFEKWQPDHTSPLSGVTFTLYDTPDCKGVPLQSAESDKNGVVTFTGLACGSYYFKETAAKQETTVLDDTVCTVKVALDGSVTIESDGKTYTGKVDEKGLVVTDLGIVNDVVRGAFEMVKVNESDPSQKLPGSKYGLYREPYPDDSQPALVRFFLQLFPRSEPNEDGEPTEGIPAGYIKIAEGWTDENGKIAFTGLLTGVKYYVRELAAPAGYQISEKPIQASFELTEPNVGKPAKIVLGDNGGGTASVDPVTGEVVWLEPVIQVGILKTSMDNLPLTGAVLALYNADGSQELARWTTDGTEHILLGSDKTPDGKPLVVAKQTYVLKELTAPDGYELAAPITFTVEEPLVGPNVNYIQHIVMKDEKTPHHTGGGEDSKPTPTPAPTGTPTTPTVTPAPSGAAIPATGDTSNPMLYLLLLLGSGAALATLATRKRRR